MYFDSRRTSLRAYQGDARREAPLLNRQFTTDSTSTHRSKPFR